MRTVLLLVICAVNLFGVEKESISAAFSRIYQTREWGTDENGFGSSGEGSNPWNARYYIDFLQQFIAEQKIKTVVDLGCGDWQIGSSIDWSGVQYMGFDVVGRVLKNNQKKFAAPNIQFFKADGTKISLPKADLFLCKEVLQHLSLEDAQKILAQCSRFKYCILVNDVDPRTLTAENVDIPNGSFHFLDLTKPPFNLPARKVMHYVCGGSLKEVLLLEN